MNRPAALVADVAADHSAAAPDLRLLLPAFSAWAVTASTLGLSAGWRLSLAAAMGLAALLGLVRAAKYRGRTPAQASTVGAAVALCLAASALCLAASGALALVREAGSVRELAAKGAVVRLQGTVASDPRVLDAGRGAVGRDLVIVRLSVASAQGRGERSLVRSRVLVFADARWSALHWGESIQASGRLAPARPGDDVVATFSARGPPVVTARAAPVERAAERMRAGLRRACAGLAPDPRGLLPGLVVGDTSLQSADLVADMRATGLTHLSAVSGMNVTIVCLLALGLGRAVGLGRRLRLVVTGVVLVGFVVLARPEPSVLRAAVMGAVGLLALANSRRRAGVPALSGAVLVLLVADPWLSRSYGFALSVLATLGLLLLARPWTRALSGWLPRPVAAGVAIPLAAQAMCGPVLVLLSGQVSLVSLPANALVAPLVVPATVLGLAAAVASVGSAWLAHLFAVLAGWPSSLVTWVARHFADVPGGQVDWPGGPGGALALAALTVLVLLVGPRLLRWARRRPMAAAGGAAVLLAFVSPMPGPSTWPPPGWVAVACDVGQGDAIVLRTGPGRAVLIDAGPAADDVDGCLRRLAVHALDAVVLTHFHADHVDGLPGALRGRTVGVVLVTMVDDPPDRAGAVRGWAAAARVPLRTAVAGERAQLGALTWQVLWPERVLHDGSVPNNASVVLRIEVSGLSLLLTGDIEPEAARLVALRLLQYPGGARIDVLKVAHHGSAKQDPGLLQALRPRLALVSVGAGNDYGHPAPSTLRMLAGLGASIARTDLQGDLAVVREGTGLALLTSGPRSHSQPVGGARGD